MSTALGHRRDDRGMATVELAAALPVLVVLLMAGLYAVQVADAQARCVDAAREVARAAARNDPRAEDLGRRAAGRSARITISRSPDTITVVVSVRVRPAGVDLPAATVSQRAVAAAEASSTDAGQPGTSPNGTAQPP
ncbi:MAG: TadE family type IV pilus minor pilin [bacterium]